MELNIITLFGWIILGMFNIIYCVVKKEKISLYQYVIIWVVLVINLLIDCFS